MSETMKKPGENLVKKRLPRPKAIAPRPEVQMPKPEETEALIAEYLKELPAVMEKYWKGDEWLSKTPKQEKENREERDVCFARTIIKAYHRWSYEKAPIVLWDIDETMLGYGYAGYRPCLRSLLAFLKRKFNVQAGILTSRGYVEEQFEGRAGEVPELKEVIGLGKWDFRDIAEYFDPDWILSSRKIEIEKPSPAEERVKKTIRTAQLASSGEKVVIMNRLWAHGINAKLIDDTVQAAVLGRDGAWVPIIGNSRWLGDVEWAQKEADSVDEAITKFEKVHGRLHAIKNNERIDLPTGY